MRLSTIVLVFASTLFALPTTRRVDGWKAPAGRAALRIEWGPFPTAAAPGRPVLVHVTGGESTLDAALRRDVLDNSAVALAAHGCHFVRLTPDEAVATPALKPLARIADPMLVVVNPDGSLRGALLERKELTARRCFALLEKASAGVYGIALDRYVRDWIRLLRRADALHTKPDAEQQADWGVAAAALRATLTPKADAAQPEVEPDGLTAAERGALAAYRAMAPALSPPRRAAALRTLAPHASAAMARALLARARGADSWTAWQAGRVLAGLAGEEIAPALLERLEHAVGRERETILRGFAGHAHPPAATALVAALSSRSSRLRAAAVEACAGQKESGTAAALLAALGDRDAAVRVRAARAVGRRKLRGNAGALRPLLADRDWCVRLAAIETLGLLRARPTVPALLERLDAERGRLRAACRTALVRIAGRDLGAGAERWRAWWNDETPPGTALELPPPVRYGPLALPSERVLFLVDTSRGMEWEDRMGRARRTLVAALEALGKRVRFNVVAFAGGVHPWEERLVPASRRRDAIRFVERLEARRADRVSSAARSTLAGGDLRRPPPGAEHKRNLYRGVRAALDVLAAEPLDETARPRADTVVLIVGGLPEEGDVQDLALLTEILTEINAGRGVAIHVASFQEQTREVYERLARANGGTSVVHPR